jgi:imidazoleglycerol-phosphate dehydratase
MSRVNLKRITKETVVNATIDIDGIGDNDIDTGVGFFNHMLESLSKHSGIDIYIKAEGDLDVDFHHTVEDVGIVLGALIKKAVENRKFQRYGYATIPMDEALVLSSVDVCNRIHLNYDCNLSGSIGSFDSELIEEFFKAFVNNAKIVLHIKQLAGSNKHHIAEAIFKSVAYSLKSALKETQETPTTKGSL